MQSLDKSYIFGHLRASLDNFSTFFMNFDASMFLQASEASEAGMDSVEAALEEAR